MLSDDQIEKQLKLHNLQQQILSKEHRILSLGFKLDSIATSIKVQSEEQILEIITEVHKTIKGAEQAIYEMKDPCYDLNLESLYQLFRSICATMINAVRLLADGCQIGVERSLLRYTSTKKKNEDISETEGVLDEYWKIENSTQRRNKPQHYNEIRNQMQIQRIYETIQSQRMAVERTTASNAVLKLSQVKEVWIEMIKNSDQILEQAYLRKSEGDNLQLVQKLHKPEYITKVIKQQLKASLKTYFMQSVQKALTKLYAQFFQNQCDKIREEIKNSKPKTLETYQQTEIEGLYKVKQAIKEKKAYDKLMKDNANLQKQKMLMAEEYIKASRNNQIYNIKIEELEKKLYSVTTAKQIERKIAESLTSIKEERLSKRSSTDSSKQVESRSKGKDGKQVKQKLDKFSQKSIETEPKENTNQNQQKPNNNIFFQPQQAQQTKRKSGEKIALSESRNSLRSKTKLQSVLKKKNSILLEDPTALKIDLERKTDKSIFYRSSEKIGTRSDLHENPKSNPVINYSQIVNNLDKKNKKNLLQHVFKFTDKIRQSQLNHQKNKDFFTIQKCGIQKVSSEKLIQRALNFNHSEVSSLFEDIIRKVVESQVEKFSSLSNQIFAVPNQLHQINNELKNCASHDKQILSEEKQVEENRLSQQKNNPNKKVRHSRFKIDNIKILKQLIENEKIENFISSQNEDQNKIQISIPLQKQNKLPAKVTRSPILNNSKPKFSVVSKGNNIPSSQPPTAEKKFKDLLKQSMMRNIEENWKDQSNFEQIALKSNKFSRLELYQHSSKIRNSKRKEQSFIIKQNRQSPISKQNHRKEYSELQKCCENQNDKSQRLIKVQRIFASSRQQSRSSTDFEAIIKDLLEIYSEKKEAIQLQSSIRNYVKSTFMGSRKSKTRNQDLPGSQSISVQFNGSFLKV